MNLENKLFRSLLRYVISSGGALELKAWRKLLSEFGNNSDSAASFVWKNKDTTPYNEIGYDRISLSELKTIVNFLMRDTSYGDAVLPSMESMLKYIQEGGADHLNKEHPSIIEKFTEPIASKLLKNYKRKQFTATGFYDVLNEAAIEQDIQKILHNPKILERITGELKYLASGSPQSKQASKNKLSSLIVIMKYIDSFEN